MNNENELLIDLLQAVDKALAERMKVVFERHQIHHTAVMLASKIYKSPGITVSELNRVTKIAKSHISNTVEQMAQKGWIEKRYDPRDQRIVQLYLTDEAVDFYKVIQAGIRDYMAGIVVQLSPDETEGLIKGLQKLKGALDKAKDRGE